MERIENLWTPGHSTLGQAYGLLHELYAKLIGGRGTRRDPFEQEAVEYEHCGRIRNRFDRNEREG
jgi:hypothetical protein